jgi:hypothetical protein
MQSLSDLNNYSLTTITFDDDRDFGVVFNLTTPIDQTDEIFENQSPALSTGIEILEIIDPVISNVVYEIDMTGIAVNVDLDFGTLPAGVTVTESPSNFFTVDGIDSELIWNQIKSPTVIFPFGTTGVATFSTTIEYTQEDSSRATKDTDYTVTITAINYMSTPGAETFDPYDTGYNPLVPSITVDTGIFNPIFTMTISPDNLVAIDEMRVTTPDSAVFTSSTDTLVINGEKDEINTALASLEIDFTGVNEDFTLTYTLTNNLNSDVDVVVQEFVSDSFSAIISSTFTLDPDEVALERAFFAEATISSATTTSATGIIAELEQVWTKTITGGTNFGLSIGFDGDYVIAGEPDHTNQSVTSNGRIHIYNASDGSLVSTIENPNTASSTSNPVFGLYTVADSGIGVVTSNNTSGADLFAYDLSTGSLNWSINTTGVQSVAIGGGRVVTKGVYNPGSGNVTRLQLYNASNGSLLDTYDFTVYSPTNDQYDPEKHLDIWGDNLIVGMYQNQVGSSSFEGQAFVFDLSGNDFDLTYTVDNPSIASEDAAGDRFGFSVSISDSRFLVGTPLEDPTGQGPTYNNGKTYVYSLSTGSLEKTLDNFNAATTDATETGDFFGWWVDAASDDCVIVAKNEDTDSDDSADRGAVYYYDHVNEVSHALTGLGSDDSLQWCAEINGNYFITGHTSTIYMYRYLES